MLTDGALNGPLELPCLDPATAVLSYSRDMPPRKLAFGAKMGKIIWQRAKATTVPTQASDQY